MPVRTQNDGDVVAKISDKTVPSQQLAVNADGSINITDNSGSLTVDASDLDIRDLAFATDKVDVGGSVVALDSTTLAALESITVQNGSGASAVNIQDGGNSITVDGSVTVSATDLDIRDLSHSQDSVKVGDGTDFLAVNPDGSINVVLNNDPTGDEVNAYNTASAIAGGSTSNHDYTVTAGKTLMLGQIFASASGKLKIEVQVETGVGTGIFVSKFVGFNSTATPNISIELKSPISVAAGVKVRVARTNKDNQAQDLYSTISGQEV